MTRMRRKTVVLAVLLGLLGLGIAFYVWWPSPGADKIDALVKLRLPRDQQRRRDLIRELSETDEEIEPAILKAMANKDYFVTGKFALIEVLGRRRTVQSREALEVIATSYFGRPTDYLTEDLLIHAAVRELRRTQGQGVVLDLLTRLAKGDVADRRRCMAIGAWIGSDGAESYLAVWEHLVDVETDRKNLGYLSLLLSVLPREHGIPLLRTLLVRANDPWTKAYCRYGLSALGEGDSLLPLVDAILECEEKGEIDEMMVRLKREANELVRALGGAGVFERFRDTSAIKAWLRTTAPLRYDANSRTWSGPREGRAQRPDPGVDFKRLHEHFRKRGGSLVSRDDALVKWKDTALFRMFEFKHHTVVIYPYTWSPSGFDVIMFAGHVRDYDNVFDAIFYEYDAAPVIAYRNVGMDLDVRSPSLRDVGFEGFYLGQPHKDVADRQVRYIRTLTTLTPEGVEYGIHVMTSDRGTAHGRRLGADFNMRFELDRLAYMDWNTSGGRRLGSRSILFPVTPVLAKGEFPIPKEMRISAQKIKAARAREIKHNQAAKTALTALRAKVVRKDYEKVLAELENAIPQYLDTPSDAQFRSLHTQTVRKLQVMLAEGHKQAMKTAKGKKPLVLKFGGKGVTMKLAYVPAGAFLMGSATASANRGSDEVPLHLVKIAKPFYMGIYEVTQQQYRAIMAANPSESVGAKKPVDNVTWDQASAFCKALSAKTGKSVRLPSEAQWEYACRAGTSTPFSTGKTLTKRDARFSSVAYAPEDAPRTVTVGSFKPNAFGLYDMHGNVWEWCADRYTPDYANVDGASARGGSLDGSRILRGGSWEHTTLWCRSAARGSQVPNYTAGSIGFRVVVPAD